jgi:hypothetical protein
VLPGWLLAAAACGCGKHAQCRFRCSLPATSQTRPVQGPLRGRPPSGVVGAAHRGAYKPIPDGYSDDLKRLVAALLQRDPRARPAAAAILAQPYVRRHVQVPTTSAAPPVLAGRTSITPGCRSCRETLASFLRDPKSYQIEKSPHCAPRSCGH